MLYETARDKIHSQKPLTFRRSEPLLWSVFLLWSPMPSLIDSSEPSEWQSKRRWSDRNIHVRVWARAHAQEWTTLICFVSPLVSVFSNTHRHARADLWAFRQANCTEKLLERWRMRDFIQAWERGRERTSAVLLRAMSRALIASMEMNTALTNCVNWICQR